MSEIMGQHNKKGVANPRRWNAPLMRFVLIMVVLAALLLGSRDHAIADGNPPSDTTAVLMASTSTPTPTVTPTPQAEPILPANAPRITARNIGRVEQLALLGKGTIEKVRWSPDGKTLAMAGSLGIWLYDARAVDTSPRLFETTEWINDIAYSPNGRFIVSGGADGTVQVWEAASGREVHFLQGHTEAVTSVAYSPNGRFIASGDRDGTVWVWDAATGNEVRTLEGHTDSVTSVAYSPNGRFIVSASRDNTVRVWEAATGREVRTLEGHTDSVTSVAYSPNGRFIAAGGQDKTVWVWEAASDAMCAPWKATCLPSPAWFSAQIAGL